MFLTYYGNNILLAWKCVALVFRPQLGSVSSREDFLLLLLIASMFTLVLLRVLADYGVAGSTLLVAQGSVSPLKGIVGICPQAHPAFLSLCSHQDMLFGVKLGIACEIRYPSRNVSYIACVCSVMTVLPSQP